MSRAPCLLSVTQHRTSTSAKGPNQGRRRLTIDWGNLRELTAGAAEFARLRVARGSS